MRKENNIDIEATSNYDHQLVKARWNSFKLYNGYRILIALTLLLSHSPLSQTSLDDALSVLPFGYLIFSILSATATWLEKPKLEITLPFQIITDILFILLFIHSANSSSTGLSLLLVIAIAAAGLISDGRLSLFYAAIATIGILFQQFVSSMTQAGESSHYTHAVMLSIACFAIAWLAHSLARRLQQSERLASQRGIDLQDLAHVNALITHRMNDGVIVVNSDLFIKHHNLQADAFLNLDLLDLKETNLNTIAPEITTLLLEWFSADSTEHNTTPNISKVNIASRELRVSFLPVAENRSQGAVVFIEDWSQIQTQAHQVKLAALGRLTAKIAHEIRNPLSSISHANQLLQEDEEIAPANIRLLQIISDNVSRLDQIIKDVLELNRRDRTNREKLHLSRFMTDFHQQFCAVENIPVDHFTLTITGNSTIVLFDSRHLNQILWNLCKNGWRHSLQNENSLQVAVYTTSASFATNIEITNDGEKIPDETARQLFEPFFTTENTGTGLGLYISKELAEANGANLQHQPTDTGTKFVMQIKKATI